jgi:hypothetical protein
MPMTYTHIVFTSHKQPIYLVLAKAFLDQREYQKMKPMFSASRFCILPAYGEDNQNETRETVAA